MNFCEDLKFPLLKIKKKKNIFWFKLNQTFQIVMFVFAVKLIWCNLNYRQVSTVKLNLPPGGTVALAYVKVAVCPALLKGLPVTKKCTRLQNRECVTAVLMSALMPGVDKNIKILKLK